MRKSFRAVYKIKADTEFLSRRKPKAVLLLALVPWFRKNREQMCTEFTQPLNVLGRKVRVSRFKILFWNQLKEDYILQRMNLSDHYLKLITWPGLINYWIRDVISVILKVWIHVIYWYEQFWWQAIMYGAISSFLSSQSTFQHNSSWSQWAIGSKGCQSLNPGDTEWNPALCWVN